MNWLSEFPYPLDLNQFRACFYVSRSLSLIDSQVLFQAVLAGCVYLAVTLCNFHRVAIILAQNSLDHSNVGVLVLCINDGNF